MAALNATFDPQVEVNVYLSSLTTSTTDIFGRGLILVDKATNSLNSNRTVIYTTYAAAVAAQGLGYISAGTLKAIQTVFAQANAPALGVMVGNVDLVGGETYATGLLACIASNPNFYWVVSNSRTSSNIVLVAEQVEECGDKAAADAAGVAFKQMVYFAQSADTTLLTGAYPAGLADLEGLERTLLCFHPTATEWFDAAHADRMSVDLSLVAPPWVSYDVANVAAYPDGTITETQRLAAQSIYVDLLLPFGSHTYNVGLGRSQAGRQMSDQVAVDYLAAAMQLAIADRKAALAIANTKVPMTAVGQQIIVGTIRGVFQQQETAGMLEATTPDGDQASVIRPLTITAADLTNKQLRFDASVLLSQAAESIKLNIYSDV